jgi:hypothetical protein
VQFGVDAPQRFGFMPQRGMRVLNDLQFRQRGRLRPVREWAPENALEGEMA